MSSRSSNKSIEVVAIASEKEDFEIHRKISLATEGFTSTGKISETTLRDRNRLSSENALTICDYIIAMKRERSILG